MPDQIYVTLSRITNVSGTYLKDKYKKSAMKVNKADEEYTRLNNYYYQYLSRNLQKKIYIMTSEYTISSKTYNIFLTIHP